MPDFIVVIEQPQPEKQTVIEIMAGTQGPPGPPGVKGEDGNVNDYDPGDLIVYFENQLL